MREIKFRAWDKEVNHMYYNSGHVIIDMKGHCFNLQTGVQLEPLLFTGLKDKNGKEIFEGDIVQFVNDNLKIIIQVKWSESSFVFARSEKYGHFGMSGISHKGEIIGNIYENENLLDK